MPPTKIRFIWPSGFRGEDLKKSTNQKQKLAVAHRQFLFLISSLLCVSNVMVQGVS
jgi:hypothetical protein